MLLPNTITVGTRAATYELWGYIQPITASFVLALLRQISSSTTKKAAWFWIFLYWPWHPFMNQVSTFVGWDTSCPHTSPNLSITLRQAFLHQDPIQKERNWASLNLKAEWDSPCNGLDFSVPQKDVWCHRVHRYLTNSLQAGEHFYQFICPQV